MWHIHLQLLSIFSSPFFYWAGHSNRQGSASGRFFVVCCADLSPTVTVSQRETCAPCCSRQHIQFHKVRAITTRITQLFDERVPFFGFNLGVSLHICVLVIFVSQRFSVKVEDAAGCFIQREKWKRKCDSSRSTDLDWSPISCQQCYRCEKKSRLSSLTCSKRHMQPRFNPTGISKTNTSKYLAGF